MVHALGWTNCNWLVLSKMCFLLPSLGMMASNWLMLFGMGCHQQSDHWLYTWFAGFCWRMLIGSGGPSDFPLFGRDSHVILPWSIRILAFRRCTWPTSLHGQPSAWHELGRCHRFHRSSVLDMVCLERFPNTCISIGLHIAQPSKGHQLKQFMDTPYHTCF